MSLHKLILIVILTILFYPFLIHGPPEHFPNVIICSLKTHVCPSTQSDKGSSEILTGHGSEHVWDEDLHQCLVQDVVAASHPLEDGFVFAQSDELIFREGPFMFLFAAGGGGRQR